MKSTVKPPLRLKWYQQGYEIVCSKALISTAGRQRHQLCIRGCGISDRTRLGFMDTSSSCAVYLDKKRTEVGFGVVPREHTGQEKGMVAVVGGKFSRNKTE